MPGTFFYFVIGLSALMVSCSVSNYYDHKAEDCVPVASHQTNEKGE